MAQPTPMNRIVRTRELWPVDDVSARQSPEVPKRRPSHAHGVQRDLEPPRYLCAPDEVSTSPFRQLYDNLQLVAGYMPRRVVMAAPSAAEQVEPIVDGLARHAVACGREVLTAALDLDGERPLLRGRDRNSTILEAMPPVENLPRPIESWMPHGSAIDLLLVGAPPLTESIHGAMLARGCDGLVIVVQPNVTRRAHLRTAIERAEYAGCRILGLVVDGQVTIEPIRRSAWSRMLGWIRGGVRG